MAIKSADQISIVDITDAYSVMMSSDSHVFEGTATAAKAGSCTTKISALRGAEQVGVSVAINEITKPTGITVTSDNNAAAPTLTITIANTVTSGGVVKIPVHITDNGKTVATIHKEFSYSISFQGATGGTGNGIKSAVTTYQVGTSGTTAPTGEWLSTVPTVPAGKYLWSRTITTYTNNDTNTSYSVGKMGEDAITLTVTSSNGTIFKNTAIATTLTAHVYVAGVEVTGTALTALGTIKWYKDGSTTATATGSTLTIDAGDVVGKATYIAQLEG